MKVPGYLVEQPLGTGSSARVWRARSRSTGETVAVKLLPAVDRAQLAAVRSEAAMLSGLDHPHLVHLHEIVPCDGALALVLDHAAGGSLATLLHARGRLTPGEVVTAIAPIGAALAYAHTAGVVHGDVSAANLLFTDVGFPLLADLGVARLVGDDAPVHSTPAYVDPAVAAGGVPAPSSDVFMLGAVALHALTGEPPWRGETAGDVLAVAAAGELEDVSRRLEAADVPEPVADVVARALALDDAHRPTAAEFALDLRHAAEPAPVELAAGRAHGDDRADPAQPNGEQAVFTHLMRPRTHRAEPARRRRRGRRSPRLLAAGAGMLIVLLAAGTVLGWVLWSPRDSGHRSSASVQPARVPPARVQPTQLTTTPATSSPSVVLSAAAAGSVLAQLDAVRARAFAQRDPRLLTGVYQSADLRAKDSALIDRIVPGGCGLYGVHTRYSAVAITARAPNQVIVTAKAALQPSTLECSGRPSGRAGGTGLVAFQIVLVRTSSGFLIEAITH
jgi:hypothetical protein